jgi:ubiquitin-protein ligase
MFSEDIKRKRLMNEQAKLQKAKLGFAQIYPNENNPMEFHFLLKGHDDSEYKGGYYIGKIKIDKDYPAKAGDFMMLTPSGRFDINKNICLSNSAYHQDEHTPLWSIENMVVGMASIFHEEDYDKNGKPKHSISHRYDSKEQRKIYAQQSLSYNMSNYPSLFPKFNQLIDEYGFPKVVENNVKEEEKPKKKEVVQNEVKPAEIVVDITNEEPLILEELKQQIVTETHVVPKKKKSIMQKIVETVMPNKNNKKKVIIQLEKPNTSLSAKERSEKIKEKLEQIKDMPFEKFDIKPYQEVNELLSPVNLSDL